MNGRGRLDCGIFYYNIMKTKQTNTDSNANRAIPTRIT